ncbi:MAG: phytanoyl-CoA dioxygenase family protein [Acidobacteriota bacterium]|nr:phytanoyl-CoA dioxygenase family protein [Acidobacteriota bacterium]
MQKLTQAQREQWAIDGYIRVEQALSPEQVAFFDAELDRIRQLPGWEPNPDGPLGHYAWLDHAVDRDPEGFMDRRVLLHYDQAFLDLMDASPVFSLPLAMKGMYLLSDITDEDCGNFTVFPGSHMRPFPDSPYPAPGPKTPGAVQLKGKAGDCILFPHSLWHGPSMNASPRARKTILYNYCQLFLRTYDPEPTPEVLERCTPRQRRLLGDLGYDFRPGSYFYAPTDQVDVIVGGASE